ncbi:hypothetical protein SSX86_032299 [Deinandra increscens subsp. villosa]|uniref:Transposase n=1 Tax=Deinandra increscens subsp. villosa TaxID=3103831 RepID=A0AAP0GI01_9ASTR
MWEIMLLVLMVLTRTRTEEDSAGTANQLVTQRSARRRKGNHTRATIATDSIVEEHADPSADQHVEQPVDEPIVDPPKRRGRGPNLNRSATSDLPKGSKLSLQMHDATKGFIGASATKFATECGIVIRSCCPMNFHKWDLVPKEVKDVMYEKLQGKFHLLRENKVFMEYVNTRLHLQWKRTRGSLSAHWKANGGRTNPQVARSKMKSDCRNEEDWNHLCDYWELESTQKYNEQMEANRAKQVITCRGGSRSIANHVFHMTNQENEMPPSPLQVYHKLHFNPSKSGWQNDDARIEYESIVQQKNEAINKLISQNVEVTSAMEHEIEKQAIKSVCAKVKTTKSAWEVGVGPVLRKKDNWMTSSGSEESQPASSETKNLKDHVVELEEKLKKNTEELDQNKEKLRQSDEKYERLERYISTKFGDFQSSISTPLGTEASGSGAQLNEFGNDDQV